MILAIPNNLTATYYNSIDTTKIPLPSNFSTVSSEDNPVFFFLLGGAKLIKISKLRSELSRSFTRRQGRQYNRVDYFIVDDAFVHQMYQA